MAETRWKLYLRRPFSLLGCSLWHAWYTSPELQEAAGVSLPHALFVEEPQGVVWHFREAGELEAFFGAMRALAAKGSPGRYLDEALRRNEKVETALKSGKLGLHDLLELQRGLGVYATTIPNNLLNFGADLGERKPETERLRAVSFYPRIIRELIEPAVARLLRQHGIPEEGAPLVTLREIETGDFSRVWERIAARKAGKRFIYHIMEEEREHAEEVLFVEDTKRKLAELGMDLDERMEVKGQTAFPGIIRGRARIIMQVKHDGTFERGDILVTLNSNPSFMPFIEKAGAIVTDEGGIGCHAAIIARELRKPCVIGTKHATRIFKDGDLVEVDAEKGIVRKLDA